MLKRMVAVILAALMLCLIFASCGEKEPADVSSKITASEEASSQKIETSSEASSSKIETSSLISSEKEEEEETETSSKKGVNRGDRGETNSQTNDSGIKQYKNAGTVMLGSFHFSPRWCDAYGTDPENRMEEFRDVVEAGYFNTYFLDPDKYLIDAAKIIAENGGTFWVGAGNYRTEPGNSIEEHIENLDFYFDILKKEGLWDIFNGFIWDEPIWNDQKNSDFLLQTKTYYTTYGKRNFPVFACGEFSDHEGNINISPDEMNKLDPAYATYVTDIAYDSYGVEVRDGYTHPASRIQNWQQKISPNIVDGKTYYTEYKKILQNYIGHPANFWYYPCAYIIPLNGGLNNIAVVDEGYCMGHLEFMTNDVLKEEYAGGIIIYTYYTFDEREGIRHFLDVTDSNGAYKLFPEQKEKWTKYSNLLRETTKKFNSIKANLAKLNV